MPRADDNETRYEKINRVAKEEGWAAAALFSSYYEEDEDLSDQLEMGESEPWQILANLASQGDVEVAASPSRQAVGSKN